MEKRFEDFQNNRIDLRALHVMVYDTDNVALALRQLSKSPGRMALGPVTYGNIYEITPFENTLCIVTMNGVLLRELFENIAAVHGEGLSGACLEISGDGKLLDATVAGKEIEDSKEYKVATLDYLAEGNDHMTAFAKVGDADKLLPEKATVRQLFLNYVNEQTKAGKKIDSKIENIANHCSRKYLPYNHRG